MDILINCTNCPHTNDIQCEVVFLEKLIYCTRMMEKTGTFTASTEGEPYKEKDK